MKAISYQLSALSVMCLALLPSLANGQEAKQKLLERVFGDAVKLDPAMVAKVKAGKPGRHFMVDRDGDGRNDEVWFIDNSPRHSKKVQPLLVRVIDEDGDLDANKGPDRDNDLYVADWNADGTTDVVIDYQDDNGDDALHEMAMYFFVPEHRHFGKDVLMAWWGRDDRSDHTLWYDVDYTYSQDLCQYRCHFSGDETFVAFALRQDSPHWVSGWENPFLFYDPDRDQCSEVVLRIEGLENKVRFARYSFDADDDAYGRRTHDYDFSITTRAPEGHPLELADDVLECTTLRGIPTQKWLKRSPARFTVAQAPWAKALLTWDEMNANTEENVPKDPHERWEGVIARGNKDFVQVGGPPCSELNKRNELSLKPAAPMRLYYDPADHRLHLRGASEGWLNVDCDLDGKVDAKYTWRDEDGDGCFDHRQVDVDADGKIDLDWKTDRRAYEDIVLDFTAVSQGTRKAMDAALPASQAFIDAAKAAVGAPNVSEGFNTPVAYAPGSDARAPETYFLTRLESWMPQAGLGAYMRKSPAGAMFYLNIVRDRLFVQLRERHGKDKAWAEIEKLYAAGRYGEAAAKVSARWKGGINPDAFGAFTRRVAIQLNNSKQTRRLDWPVALAIKDIRKVASDFNSDNCAVVASQRWLDWRQIPHQVDEITPAVGQEISFLADLPDNEKVTYYLYYSPSGKSDRTFARKTATAEDWVPPNIGWESNRGSYRLYWGQFDFFGKNTSYLVYDNIAQGKSYHEEVEWGIDALHVGNTSGIGGLTLYVDDKPCLVQNPSGKGNVVFTKKQVVKGPVRAVIEVEAANVVPDKPDLKVRIQCLSYAERQESEIRATLTGGDVKMMLAPGLVKLPREQTFVEPAKGYLGVWGWQEPVIDDIGMSIIVPPKQVVNVVDLPEERRIRCRTSPDGSLQYWILGDWRRGRQYPVSPNVDNWRKETETLAAQLQKDVPFEIGKAESVKP